MAEIFNWVVAHIKDIASIICAVILVSSLIVKVTPSVKDNEFLSKVIGFLDKLSIAQTTDNRKYIDDAKRNLK